jgi:hypothetical protein
MKSKIPDDLLSAFLDREVTPDEDAVAKSHLRTSQQAKQEFQDYQRLTELLRELRRQTVPPEFAAAVMQQAERETLIPLETAGIVDGDPHLKRPSRRAWILTAIAVVTAAVIALLFINLHSQKNELAFKESAPVESSAKRALEEHFKTVAPPAPAPPSAAGKTLALAKMAKPNSAAAALKPSSPAPLGAAIAVTSTHAQAPTSNASQLVFPADLKTAKEGDVVEALESIGDQVAVVRLTVVNQTAGVGGLQSLLVRDARRYVKGEEKAKLLKGRFADGQRAVTVEDRKGLNTAGDLICVYVEGSRDELVGVLKDVQMESQFQQAQLTNTISAAKLAEYANRPVSPSGREGDRNSSPAKTVLSLPHAAVDKIFADNVSSYNASKDNELGIRRREQEKLPAIAPPAGKFDSFAAHGEPAAAAGEIGSPAQHVAGTKGKSKTAGGKQLVASTQRSFQVFFVIVDQSSDQSESIEKPPVPSETQVAPEPTRTVRPRKPVRARHPAKKRPPAPENGTD